MNSATRDFMERNWFGIGLISLVLLSILMVSVPLIAVGYGFGLSDVREEATRVGVAHWVTDSNGKPKFEWIVPLEKK